MLSAATSIMWGMKAFLFAVVLTVGLAGPASAATWGSLGFFAETQAQKNRQGPAPGRADPGREQRFERRERQDERRERMNEDERRALHRDLDKANRELYRHRFQK